MERDSFPPLTKVARKYLCICDTNVPSERVFSRAGHVCNDSRSQLLPDNVNKLIFVHCNSYYMYVLLYSQQFDTIIVIIVTFLVDNNHIVIFEYRPTLVYLPFY